MVARMKRASTPVVEDMESVEDLMWEISVGESKMSILGCWRQKRLRRWSRRFVPASPWREYRRPCRFGRLLDSVRTFDVVGFAVDRAVICMGEASSAGSDAMEMVKYAVRRSCEMLAHTGYVSIDVGSTFL